MEKTKAPGLKWMKRSNGFVPVWVADEVDVKAGFAPKTVSLKAFADQPDILKAKCAVLQAEMHLWRTGHRTDPLSFDGTIESVLSIYQRHEESPFRKLKPSTRRTYVSFLTALETHIGGRRVDSITGVDMLRWHKAWSGDGTMLASAATTRAVLESAISFGVMNKLAGCVELLAMMREARRKLPRPNPRTAVIATDQVAAARASAHARGRGSAALAYALTFETTLRLWDVIGQWWPIAEGGLSDVVDAQAGVKWFGLRWEDIDEHMVLRYTPSKTDGTTGKTVAYPLTKAPMVMEELERVPLAERKGPVIKFEETALPYNPKKFQAGWRKDRKAANLPAHLWARDLRASGITEGRERDVSTDDAAKVAGHSSKSTTSRVYDRAVLAAADRFAEARIKGREQSDKNKK